MAKRAAGKPAVKLTRADIKQKIRALKKDRSNAGQKGAKAKVEEFNSELRRLRRRLRKAARRKKP